MSSQKKDEVNTATTKIEKAKRKSVPKKPAKKSTNEEKPKSAPIRKEKRAGIIFPVGRIKRYLKQQTNLKRVSPGAALYLASVLEYLTAELGDLGYRAAKENKRDYITPRLLNLAINNDDELCKLVGETMLLSGGVFPRLYINKKAVEAREKAREKRKESEGKKKKKEKTSEEKQD